MISCLLLLPLAILSAASSAAKSKQGGPTSLVYQFPNLTRVENIAVRSNGQLLVTLLTQPELRSINPSVPNPQTSLVYQFPNATSVFGITETEPDVFAVATANLSFTGAYAPKDYAVWVVNLRKHAPEVRKAASIPGSGTLNGLARLSHNTVLGSDIVAGAIHRIDLNTGNSAVVIQDDALRAPVDLPGFGVNGIRTHGRYLYFVNIGKGLLGRIPIDSRTGAATGPVEIISDGVRGVDDFALSKTARTVYAASLFQNALVEVASNGETEIIAGGPDGALFVGPTSAQLGRTPQDRNVVYVVSSGAVFDPSTGGFNSVEGGKVVAVKLQN